LVWLLEQVGCPESGIEEAVQRLTAAGYKVGRIEQTETAAEAKQKRGNKVSCLAVAAYTGSVIIWVLTTGGSMLRQHCDA
jgi:DNA mismatch repair ATPase MutS